MSAVDIVMDGVSVMVGIPAGRDFHPHTVKSLIGTFTKCASMNVECRLGMIVGSSVVQWARDEVVDEFLKSGMAKLFWIDSDIVWDPDDFVRLLALSTEVDVVCATYPLKRDQPTFILHHDEERGMANGEFGLLEIYGAGLGFTVMSREVVEKLAAAAPRIKDEISGNEMASVFRIDSTGGKRQGEDMAFFSDIRALGYKVWLDPEVKLGHIGIKVYRGDVKDAFKK